MTRRTCLSTVVIGGGHNGLAMSKRLSEKGIDHVVLKRDEVASSWRTQRWDSFTLLTPNWQTRLPGCAYDGDDPDDFMTGEEIASYLQDYAGLVGAPVQTGTTVTAVRAGGQWIRSGVRLRGVVDAFGRPRRRCVQPAECAGVR